MGRLFTTAFVLSLYTAGLCAADSATIFQQQVADTLGRHCLQCHNQVQREGGLSLATAEDAFRGGDSGALLEAGDPAASLLMEMISGEEPEMPKDADALSAAQIDAMREWIATGAVWPAGLVVREPEVTDTDWWSLQPLTPPPVPTVDGPESSWVRTPIDNFIFARLRENGLSPAPKAERRVLIRRLYFDLLGLPPSFAEVEQFAQDDDPRAYDNLVDRLLNSPHYGERWARHWLDVVHYGDTHGYDKDKPRPHAWPYRDYVIRSLNNDKPYYRFVMEQVAGDVLWPDQHDGIEATGFIAAGPWDFIGHAEVPETKYDGQVARNLDRDDMVTSTINTFLSLTVQCARCHNHKFDPITQEQYYSLQSVFAALDRADRTYDLDPAVAARRHELTQQRPIIEGQQAALAAEIQRMGGEPLVQLDQQIKDLADDSSQPSQEQLDELKRQRATLVEQCVPSELRAEADRLKQQLQALITELESLPPEQRVYAGTVHHGSGAFQGTGANGGKPREIHVLYRGELNNPGPLVGPGALPIIPGVDWQFSLPADHQEGDRRVALAKWLVRRDNPLVWRSFVNRIWLYHFGRGLVDSPNDFGRMGQLPSHPQLLDWLAATFRDGDQSIKNLHRLIVTSHVYRQSSADRADCAAVDADNRFLWRMNRQLLSAEAIRDSVLAVSGKLDRHMYGPAFMDFVIERPEHSPHYEYHKYDPDDVTTHRRSVYRFLVRSQQQPFMQSLGCADPSQSVAKRDPALTSIQALTLLNNRFMVRMSEHFARHLEQQSSELTTQIDLAYREALSRRPTTTESAELTAFAQEFGLPYACRLIMNLNEFVFVD